MERRRIFDKPAVAGYLSLSTASVDDWVRRGLIPGPIPGTHRYDKKAIDRALDKLSGIPTTTTSIYDEWKAGQGAREA